MSDLTCPSCVATSLGAPYQFGGVWLAACRKCHSETRIVRTDEADTTAPNRLAGTPAVAAETYRRRTPF